MANGNGVPKLPGIFVGGAFGVSTGVIALAVGGALLWTWLTMNRIKAPVMDDETLGHQVENDVLAYAAHPQSVAENRDRIREAINRIRDKFTEAREAYIKKIRDLHIALRNKLITREQFQAQLLSARTEFRAAIKSRHREIMQELNIPHFASNIAQAMPTLG